MKSILSKIPSVNAILNNDSTKELLNNYSRLEVKEAIKEELEKIKNTIKLGNLEVSLEIIDIVKNVEKYLNKNNKNSLRRVINATGTILHTNLGRSLLSEKVKENIESIAFNYSNLEFDIENKKRGSRYTHLSDIIKKITGAEDVLVVNNNAAAVLLVLSTLGKDKEIIVSRGELVEIGGSFRIPEIIKLSGGILKEVGTTNKTHLKDYENEITENTGVILKVHASNYKLIGFTKSVNSEEISNLAKEKNIVSVHDLGSGQFIDFQKYGLSYEPTVKEVLDTGIDIVTFSGDKLLGASQAGIIVGKKEYIEKIKKNQLTRALRVDKLTLAALEATLKLYLDEKIAIENIPTLKMITMNKSELEHKASEFKGMMKELDLNILVEDSCAEVGGGSYPGEKLDSVVVKVSHNTMLATDLEKEMLELEIPIITRIKDNYIIFDMRTLRKKEFLIVRDSIKTIIDKYR